MTILAAQAFCDEQDMLAIRQARFACRSGMASSTAGVASGHVQGNLAILPERLAASFHRFCQLNPKPCPIIGMSDVDDPRIPSLGIDRHPHRYAALSRLARWRGRRGADRHHGTLARRSRCLRAGLLAFIRRSPDGRGPADLPHRAQGPRADVSHQ